MEATIFYCSDGINKFGPFSKEELKTQNIKPDTLVWFDGLTEWKRAGELPEMKAFLPVVPPPLPVVAPVPVPPPMPQTVVQPAPHPAPQPVEPNIQPVLFTEQPRPARKKYSLLLFIFSFVGMVMSLSMIGYASFIAAGSDRSSYKSYNYITESFDRHYYSGIENEGWGAFFIIVAIFLLVFSILMCVKMAKQLKQARRNR